MRLLRWLWRWLFVDRHNPSSSVLWSVACSAVAAWVNKLLHTGTDSSTDSRLCCSFCCWELAALLLRTRVSRTHRAQRHIAWSKGPFGGMQD
jgi:hypothetical protein